MAAMAASAGGGTGADAGATATTATTTATACHVVVPPTVPRGPASCRMLTWHQPIYVGGHYLKWARGVPQSPWIADGEAVGEGSVQTSLEAVVVKCLRADGSKLNSAGREDMDVRMLAAGGRSSWRSGASVPTPIPVHTHTNHHHPRQNLAAFNSSTISSYTRTIFFFF